MRAICPICKSSDVYIVLPGDINQNMKLARQADGRMKEDTEIPMSCRRCGYGWSATLRKASKFEIEANENE